MFFAKFRLLMASIADFFAFECPKCGAKLDKVDRCHYTRSLTLVRLYYCPECDQDFIPL